MNFNTQELLENTQKFTKEFSTQSTSYSSAGASGNSTSTSLFMGLSMGAIVVSFLFSMVGLGYFRYGKKNQSFLFMMSGILLMVFPYVVHDTIYILLTGAAICSLPFLLKRFF